MLAEKIISRLCFECFSRVPTSIERCGVGQGNYVYIVEYLHMKYIVRCSLECNAYENTVYWLEKLSSIEIPVPKIIEKGKFEEYFAGVKPVAYLDDISSKNLLIHNGRISGIMRSRNGFTKSDGRRKHSAFYENPNAGK